MKFYHGAKLLSSRPLILLPHCEKVAASLIGHLQSSASPGRKRTALSHV